MALALVVAVTVGPVVARSVYVVEVVDSRVEM